MTEHNLIKKDDSICLLEDNERCFLIHTDGAYMSADRMIELANKMIATAKKYSSAISNYNSKKEV